jgi:hypothetical protein
MHGNMDKLGVDHPEHYIAGTIEVIDVIESFGLNFNLGNVVKYILRADKKSNRAQDLHKALWYLTREISNVDMEKRYDK